MAHNPLIGTWKLRSMVVDVDSVSSPVMGSSPLGFLVFTPARMVAVGTADGRKPSAEAAGKAALLDSMFGYSGPYRIDAEKFVTAVEVSWNESWTGTEQVRFWKLSDDRLTLTSAPGPYWRDPSKTAVARVEWEKVE
jgi:hypothetical protein